MYFVSKNLVVEKIISQSRFLQKMGIMERFNILANKIIVEIKGLVQMNVYLDNAATTPMPP